MKSIYRYILFVFLTTMFAGCHSDYSSMPVCRVENDRIIFKLYKRWSPAEKKEIIGKYELDSSLVEKAFSGKGEVMIDSVLWQYKTVNQYFAELSKPLDKSSGDFLRKNEVLIINDSWLKIPMPPVPGPPPPPYPSWRSFGINKFEKKSSFSYENGVARFFIPGYRDASTVFLSGSFNDWSTMQNSMTKTDTGWVIQVKLNPGKYLYKYIIDGKWRSDPLNLLKEKDDQKKNVSVVYCPNHEFLFNDKLEARQVIVTGNFTNWNTELFPMEKTRLGWVLNLYLPEGTYTYKFIADGEWTEDKANPDNRKDANGNVNSFFSIGDKLTFRLSGHLNASRVILAGSFNGWREDELLMEKDSAGWHLSVALAAGNYEYKFIVDGKWLPDPSNPFKSGSGDYTNSFLSFKPNHTFVLENIEGEANVFLAGSFNGWKPERMVRQNNRWILPVYLTPGKYTYKFVVGMKWILDPGNELFEGNEYGTGNSVLWIE